MDALKTEYKKKKQEIISRLNSFKNLNDEDIFYELCFCILTVQSKALKCDKAIQKLREDNFYNKNINPHKYIKKIRFHNNKSIRLRKVKENFPSILKQIKLNKNPEPLREYLVKNILGYGYKESSHFLRNIGFENLAILDRHILKHLKKHKVINEIPKTITKKKYFEIENKFKNFSNKVNIPIDHLDLLFWSQETGIIFK